ncbi:MAG: adenylyltransferase [Pseudomonadota bacterium]|jgi:molybdopterin/thiamine biosynthesis adenylyltransferase
MNDQQLMRYSRHILLPEIDIGGQQQVLRSTALVIGLGGLGSPAALYLAASGVGRLLLCDHDTVELGNLQRQIIHRTSSIGQTKVESAVSLLRDINPEVVCVAIPQRLADETLAELIQQADVVLDCSDNFETRYAVNRACLQYRTPLVSGAAIQFEGQVSVFDFRHANIACYNCLFPEDSVAAELRCATTGVFSPLVGIIGAMQAAEALKILMGIERGLSGKLLTLNALDMKVSRSGLAPDADCAVCGVKCFAPQS